MSTRRIVAVGSCALSAALGFAPLAGCSIVAGLGQFDHATAASAEADGVDGSTSSVDPAGDASNAGVDAPPEPATPDAQEPEPGRGSDDGGDAPVNVGDGPSDGDTEPVDSWLDDGRAPVDAPPGSDAPIRDIGASDALDAASGTPDAGRWCMAHASSTTFDCHDFDEGASAASGFTSHFYSGNFGTVTSTDFAPGSAPSCLRITTPAIDAGYANDQYNEVLLYHGKLEISFAVKIAGYDSKINDLSLFRVSYQNNAWAESIDFHGPTGGLYESWSTPGGGTKTATHPVTVPTFSSWTTMDLIVDLDAHTMSLSYDGVPLFTANPIFNPVESNPALFVQVGVNYLAAPSKPLSIYYDDIVVSTPP